MGDASGVQGGDRPPGVGHLVVAEVGAAIGQGHARDRVVRHQGGAGRHVGDHVGLGDPQPEVAEPQRHERRSLGGFGDRHEQLSACCGAGADPAVEAGDGVAIAVAVAADVDRQVEPLPRRPVRVGHARRPLRLGEGGHGDPDPAQGGGHGGAGRRQIGRPDDQQRHRPAGHAQPERDDDVDRQVRAGHDPHDRQDAHRHPQRARPAGSEPPDDHDDRGRRPRQVGGGRERAAGDPALALDQRLPRRRLRLVDDAVPEQRREARPERHPDQDSGEHPQAAGQDGGGHHHHGGDHGPHLGEADRRGAGGGGEAADRPGEVGLHAAEGVGRGDGQPRAEDGDGDTGDRPRRVEGRPALDGAGPLVDRHAGCVVAGRRRGGAVGRCVAGRRRLRRHARRVRHVGSIPCRVAVPAGTRRRRAGVSG